MLYETCGHERPQHMTMNQAIKLFDDVFRDLGLFIAMIDKQGKILAMNDKARKIAGFITRDVAGKDFHSIFISNEICPGTPERSVRCIRTNSGTLTRILCSSDDLYENGNITGSIVYGIEMPGSMKKPNVEPGLEDRLMLYTDILSHDIKNYNQVALGYIEMARDKACAYDIACLLESAYGAIKRSDELVACVKKLIDIESDAPIDRVSESLKDIIDRNVSAIRNAYPQRMIQLHTYGDPDISVSSCTIIDDAFYNVLDNAVRYDLHEPVKIDIETKVRDDGYAYLLICDRGPGIPDSMKPVIFKRNNKSAHGWGMGLSIAKAIIERLGGRISVSDRVNGDRSKGSVFKIILPVEK